MAQKASPEASWPWQSPRSIFHGKKCSEAGLVTSGFDWTAVYPVGLADGPSIGAVEVRSIGEVKKVRACPWFLAPTSQKRCIDYCLYGSGAVMEKAAYKIRQQAARNIQQLENRSTAASRQLYAPFYGHRI